MRVPAYRNLRRASVRRCVYPLYRLAARIKGGFTIPSRRRIVRWKDTRPCSSIFAGDFARMYGVFVKISSASPASPVSRSRRLRRLSLLRILERPSISLGQLRRSSVDGRGRLSRLWRFYETPRTRARIARTLAERSDGEKARRA